ncbi:unnamed protein product [Rotaria sp. Silwood1]|nr:unnamed protein product [Rotaria sp. Silwood1]
MNNLNSVNDVNEAIKKLKEERDARLGKLNQRGKTSSKSFSTGIEELNERINQLTRTRNQKLRSTYTRPVIRPSASNTSLLRSKIDTRVRPDVKRLKNKPNTLTIKMAPLWYEYNDPQQALKGIVYPPNAVELRPFNTIACYRMTIGQSNNFRQHPISARARVGFGDDTVLQYVKPGEYTYSWVPMLSYLQLNANDFARKNNVDYRKSGLPESERHGGYPYYLPIGWYYHALKLDQKYSDGDVWFGSVNATGEWPVAFHGTHSSTVDGITQKGLVTSVVEADTASSKMMESTMNQPEIYLTTHCNGGAHPHYTKPFHLEIPDKKKNTFRIVFMCRAQPGKFTTHQVSTSTGHTWRFVDPDAVRPYGILIKDEDTLDKS